MTERECVEAIKAGRNYMVVAGGTGPTVHEQIQRYTMIALSEMRGEIARLTRALASREQRLATDAPDGRDAGSVADQTDQPKET